MVMFMGHGVSEQGRDYLAFLNTHGPGFGNNGIGRVYFDNIIQDQTWGFYTIDVDDLDEDPSVGTPPPTCGKPPSSGGPPPPPGGPAPPGCCSGQVASSPGSSMSKKELEYPESYSSSKNKVVYLKETQVLKSSSLGQYPSVSIYNIYFTVGHGGKHDLKLTDSFPGALVCKLKHARRGAAIEVCLSKAVYVNGKALDRPSKVTLIGGDEVIFCSLGRHAYIFQQLTEEKSSTSTFSSPCVVQQGQYPVIKSPLDHLSYKRAKLSVPFSFGKGHPPFVPHDTEIVSSLCKTMEEQGQFSSEENVSFAQHQLLKEDLKKAVVSASDISESFDSFPYYLRAPDYGSQGEVRLPFEENGSSKIGVTFDKLIPGGIDLGGSCEVDHGLFCSVDSLCLDGPGWEDRAKQPCDIMFEFVSEESEHGPLVLFLKDVEKVCGNSYSYHGLKSKLEIFPAGVFIIGSQIQTDTRKDKLNNGSPFLSKFPYSQAAIFDLAFQDNFGRVNDKNKEAAKTAKHVTKHFPSSVTIQPPQDDLELSQWKQLLDRDVEILKEKANISKVQSFLTRHGLECADVETTLCVKDRTLTNECVDKIVGYALSHEVMNPTVPNPGNDVFLALSGESLQRGVDLSESMQNGHKKKSTKKSLKINNDEVKYWMAKGISCTSDIQVNQLKRILSASLHCPRINMDIKTELWRGSMANDIHTIQTNNLAEDWETGD